ncbi:hypothetical protein HDV03_000202 [Kappamyces sp. JEL0829]|nr:hypothetical protein HDV03_000202 [Kappamyces sp. JEL0829]
MPRDQKPNKTAKQTKKYSSFQIENETRGFFVTCRRGKERLAQAELVLMLDEWRQKLYGDSEKEVEYETVEDELEAELASLKQKKGKKVFAALDTFIDCCLFIRCSPPVDPVPFAHSLLTDLYTNKLKKTRYCSRFIPISTTCQASHEAITAMATKEILSFFHPDRDPTTFAIEIKIRNNSHLDRDRVIKEVASLVPAGHTVDLKNPCFTIMLEVINLTCGMSIVTDYFLLKKYSLEEVFPKPTAADASTLAASGPEAPTG